MNPETVSRLTAEELAIIDKIFAEITRQIEEEIQAAGDEAKRLTFTERVAELLRSKVKERIKDETRAELIITACVPLIFEKRNALRQQAKPTYRPKGVDKTRRMFEDTEEPDWNNLETNPANVIDPMEPVVHEDPRPPQRSTEVQPDLFE